MSLFGNTVRQVGRDLGLVSSWDYLLPDDGLQQRNTRNRNRFPGRDRPPSGGRSTAVRVRAVMQIVVSIVMLGGGLIVLLKGNKDAGQAAAGIMGTVVGYWLR
jgi:hypothetical protein